jgi:hypothetical protein
VSPAARTPFSQVLGLPSNGGGPDQPNRPLLTTILVFVMLVSTLFLLRYALRTAGGLPAGGGDAAMPMLRPPRGPSAGGATIPTWRVSSPRSRDLLNMPRRSAGANTSSSLARTASSPPRLSALRARLVRWLRNDTNSEQRQ